MDSDVPTSIGRVGVMALDCPDALADYTADPAGHPFCLVLAP